MEPSALKGSMCACVHACNCEVFSTADKCARSKRNIFCRHRTSAPIREYPISFLPSCSGHGHGRLPFQRRRFQGGPPGGSRPVSHHQGKCCRGRLLGVLERGTYVSLATIGLPLFEQRHFPHTGERGGEEMIVSLVTTESRTALSQKYLVRLLWQIIFRGKMERLLRSWARQIWTA